MVIEDGKAKSEAQRTWGNEEAVQLGVDRSRSTRTGRASSKARREPFPPHRNDRAGRNLINQCGQATLGGIIDRLIAKVIDEIAESELRTADRKKYLLELQELSKQLRQEPENTD